MAMGYNACKKAGAMAEKLEYILAIELLSAFQAQPLLDPERKRGEGSARVLEEIGRHVPVMEEDMFLHPHIEYLRELIHSGRLVELAEEAVGELS